MNLKHLYLLTAATALLALVAYFAKNADRSPDLDPRVGQSVLLDIERSEIAEVILDFDGEQITLRRRGQGESESWGVSELYDLPANTSKLKAMVDRLRDAVIERAATSRAERIATLGFGSETFTLRDSDGETMLQVQLGRVTDQNKQLLLFQDGETAFVASDSLGQDSILTNWLGRLLDLDRDNILAATFPFPEGSSLSIQRKSALDDWSTQDALPEGMELDQGAIIRALNRLTSISADEILAPDDPQIQAAAAYQREVAMTLDDGTHYSIQLSQTPELRVSKQVESVNDEGETVTEEEEQVETPASPTFIKIFSSDPNHPLNEGSNRAGIAAGEHIYSSLPKALDELLTEVEPAAEAE